MLTYDELNASAFDAERHGYKRLAAQRFDAAAAATDDHVSKAEALQLAGVNWRSTGAHQESDSRFAAAYRLASLAQQPCLADAILRDWAMLRADQGNLEEARYKLLAARSAQLQRGELLETACTEGFLGRVHWLQGQRAEALSLFASADRGLASKPDWRLNNAIWWMKACDFWGRLVLAPRTITLAYQSGYRRRATEALALLVGGNRLYDRLRANM